MHVNAINQARERLGRAKRAFAMIQRTRNFAEFESAWTDFLLAFSGVYSKLQKGAVSNPTAKQWFGGKKRERREDPLLSYVGQARNADEHGIEPTTEFVPGGLGIGYGGEEIIIDYLYTDGIGEPQMSVRGAPGQPRPSIRVYSSTVVLRPVEDDRFGDIFQPPKSHLGRPIEATPLKVIELAISYLERLIDEAEGLRR